MTAASAFPPQTTLLIGGSNGTATLCAILGDKSNPNNINHTLRVATRSAKTYLNEDGVIPRVWRCQEKKHISDLVASDMLPTRVMTHVGAPDSVFVYANNDTDDKVVNNSTVVVDTTAIAEEGGRRLLLSPLERAISGISAPDNGGVADIIILACPVSAHLSLLRHVAKALYHLDTLDLLGGGGGSSSSSSKRNRPPIMIGTLYGAGGFDWQCRVAFFEHRPPSFTSWTRPLGLFALKAFPYLCKSLRPGEVTLHGRFPQLQVAVTPSNAYTRNLCGRLLDRVLQNEVTGKTLDFLGLSANEKWGGDGTVGEEKRVLMQGGTNNYHYGSSSSSSSRRIDTVVGARNAMIIAAHANKQLREVKEGHVTGSGSGGAGGGAAAGAITASVSSHPLIAMSHTATSKYYDNNNMATKNNNNIPSTSMLDVLLTQSISDHADPVSTLGFLTCTLNSTNQILHPCILVALFGQSNATNYNDDDDGTITWNTKKELTPLPRFYADGAARPLAGELITSIAGGEMYFVIDAIERLLSPRGYDPLSALHGGEPIGRKVMNLLGNSPHDLGVRSGLTDAALQNEWQNLFGGEQREEGEEEEDNDGIINNGDGGFGSTPGLINRERMLAFLMSYGLKHNSRLGGVLSPCIIDESSKNNEDGNIRIRPNPTTRFFTDDVQHGLCIYLGLAELLGFNLERDMKTTLYVVRRLQHWMKKEFVLPNSGGGGGGVGGGIVSSAKDLAETSAPQAFGIHTVQELKHFLRLDVFGEKHQDRTEDRLRGSGLVSRL